MIRATAGQAFELTIATNPAVAGSDAKLIALYGLDGVSTGLDGSGDDLVFPVDMVEGASGVYSTEVILPSDGPYWARVEIDGEEAGTLLIAVSTAGAPAEDAEKNVPFTLAAVVDGDPEAVQLTMVYSDGSSAGGNENGEAIVWPQEMIQVDGYQDSWYYGPVLFDEGGVVQTVITPSNGTSVNSTISVYERPQAGVLAHFDGWEPDAALVPSKWVTLSYIRKWTGWTTAHISDADLRELRRMAIETFIHETNRWVPGWNGTWHGLRAQGSRLYLPVPVVLPSEGGVEPVVSIVNRYGDKRTVQVLPNDYLIWRVSGYSEKQPYVEYEGRHWDTDLDVKIYATWGSTGVDRSGVPMRLKQAIVGLIRWHGLSFGTDGEDARDQSVLWRTTSEASRDARVTYHESAIGGGLTGDRTVDRLLAEFTIYPGPWVNRRRALT